MHEVVRTSAAVGDCEAGTAWPPSRTPDTLSIVERLRRNVAEEHGVKITQVHT
jgi:hypothetical protein